MKNSLSSRQQHRASRRGVALLLVLACLLLLATLVLGLLISSQNNLKSSKLYANGSSVKTLADSTVSLVMAEIQQATSNGTQIAWASQPGMIRTYGNDGMPLTDYRLYSWDSPTLSGTGSIDPASDVTSITGTSAWYNNPAQFFDLNQPVQDATGTLHYPIADGNPVSFGAASTTSTPSLNYTTPGQTTPNAITYTNNGVTPAVEGFWVSAPGVGSGPVVNPTTLKGTPNYIPMPVKWLYVLQDGSIVTPDLATGTQVHVTGASPTNPIVGRISYWTDDETAKVNINTASEGSYWDTPRTQGISDWNQARNQPVQNEFQRYPGHPATTCLSSVFGSLSSPIHSGSYTTFPSNYYTPYQFYYDISPKLNSDITSPNNLGSQAGTVAYNTSTTLTGSLLLKSSDRLYTSVDELLFKSNLITDDAHTTTMSGAPPSRPVTSSGTITITPSLLEMTRFFLTASSRAPDVNLFNQPRVVSWPISSKTGPAWRTAWDSYIAFCGSVGQASATKIPYTYYFQRLRNDHPTNDLPSSPATIGLGRNRMIMTYLSNLTSVNVPGFGGNFLTKYPNASGGSSSPTDHDQILTEIFDYIRCLNLIDQSTTTMVHPFAPIATGTNYTASGAGAYAGTTGSLTTSGTDTNTTGAGNGQVVPIYDSATQTKGFGRFPTIQEVAIGFIATGWNDGAGGNTSNNINVWLSGTTTMLTGTTQNLGDYTPSITYTFALSTSSHAKGDSAPWGYYANDTGSFVTNPSSPPWTYYSQTAGANVAFPTIPPANIQVQPVLLISFFDPSRGYVNIHPTLSVQAIGLGTFTWTTSTGSLSNMGFPSGQPNDISNMFSSTGGQYAVAWGGNMGPRSFVTGLAGNAAPGSNSYYPFIGAPKNFPYNPANPSNPGTFSFSGGTITLNVLLPALTGSWNASTSVPNSSWPKNTELSTRPPIQQITLSFPPATLPLPTYDASAVNNKATANRQDRGVLSARFEAGSNNFGANPEFIWGGVNSNAGSAQAGDTVRSIRAYPGDMRMIAGQVTINGTSTNNGYFDSAETLMNSSSGGNQANWVYDTATSGSPSTYRLVHSMIDSSDYPYYGSLMGQLVPGVTYSAQPATAGSPFIDYTSGLNTFCGAGNGSSSNGAIMSTSDGSIAGDWDNGFGYTADGPYINKPDEGNLSFVNSNLTVGSTTGIPYFTNTNDAYTAAGQTYFSPNRLMPGPGMFGSLPTGVIRNQPWKTLLFCANPAGGPLHPGFGTTSSGSIAGPCAAPPFATPPDYLMLDLFNMPVVEPYPISEPLSTAGRVNMNYQIVPFTYIERSTGMHAVLKGERMTVISDRASGSYKAANGTGANEATNWDFRVPINADLTLLGFDNYFTANKDIFRSAAQICSLFLYPQTDAAVSGSGSVPTSWSSNNSGINSFWYGTPNPGAGYSVSTSTPSHYLTGDNSRERPYTTIYPRLTTKSNTFTIHYCVETLKKVNSGSAATAATWDDSIDQVTGQYRGSTIIERYVDPNDTLLPDFTTGTAAVTLSQTGTALDAFYKFRVISSKQFAP